MSSLQEIKQQFMAFRNGVVADTLRAGGLSCYRVIFGLNLPQLKQIAERLSLTMTQEEQRAKADELWADKGVRESRLLAMHLYGTLPLSDSDAFSLAAGIQSREEAEILCLRVLRSHPAAPRLLEDSSAANPLRRHLQAILSRHLNEATGR